MAGLRDSLKVICQIFLVALQSTGMILIVDSLLSLLPFRELSSFFRILIGLALVCLSLVIIGKERLVE